MPTRVHDRVMLGAVTVFFFSMVAAISGFLGALGPALQVWVLETLDHLKAFEKQHEAFETLGKVAGITITLLTGAYAIWQRYHFAEFNMQKRLNEFQERVETRLSNTNQRIDAAVQRPSPHRKFEAPIFERWKLKWVLWRMKWGWWRSANKSLQRELDELTQQLKSWDGKKTEYELRKAQACLVKGAVAAAWAGKREGPEARKANDEARDCFQQAFQLSNTRDGKAQALEYMGHQQVRLGEFGPALLTFKELEKMAPEEKSLLRARALKFQAGVYEFRPTPNLNGANGALKDAVIALPPTESYLERAEIHEMHGSVRYQLNFRNSEQSYIDARHAYQSFIRSKPSRKDARVAKKGLERVEQALKQIWQRWPPDDDGATPPEQPSPETQPAAQ